MDLHRPVDPVPSDVDVPVRLIVKPLPPPLPLNVRSGWIEIVLLLVTESVSVAPGWQNAVNVKSRFVRKLPSGLTSKSAGPPLLTTPWKCPDFALGTSSFAIVPVAVA